MATHSNMARWSSRERVRKLKLSEKHRSAPKIKRQKEQKGKAAKVGRVKKLHGNFTLDWRVCV